MVCRGIRGAVCFRPLAPPVRRRGVDGGGGLALGEHPQDSCAGSWPLAGAVAASHRVGLAGQLKGWPACSVLQRGVPGQEGGAGVGGCGQGACLGVILQSWVWLEVAGGLLIFWKGQVGVLPSFLPAAQPPPGSQSSVFPFFVFVGNGRLFTG